MFSALLPTLTFLLGFYFFDFPTPKVMANLFQMTQKAMCA
jgi:hypothetical protein